MSARAALARIIAVGGLALVATLDGRAQQTQRPTFRAGVQVVRIDVLATDGGKPIPGLTPADFEVRDNGVLQKVDLANTADHVAVVIVLDLSGSVEQYALKELYAACQSLVGAMHPDDRAWLVSFADHWDLRTGPTTDMGRLKRALEQLKPGGRTSMWDAIVSGVSLVTGLDGRSLVLVFSDGMDTSSWLDEDRAVDVLKRSEVVVSSVQPRNVLAEPVPLERAARATGGTVLEAARAGRLPQQFVDLLNEFRLGYVLTYTPAGVGMNDGWHKVSVKLKDRPGKTRAREGYYAGAK
jgi:VWFA-related protein